MRDLIIYVIGYAALISFTVVLVYRILYRIFAYFYVKRIIRKWQHLIDWAEKNPEEIKKLYEESRKRNEQKRNKI